MASPTNIEPSKRKEKQYVEVFKLVNLKNPKPNDFPYTVG